MSDGEVVIKNLDLDPRFSRRISHPTQSASDDGNLSVGSLLRLFRSEFFDTLMAVTYLYKYRHNPGVLDYICNELYGLEYEDLERYLPQLCHMIVYHLRGNSTIERFVMDKCAHSIHFALQVYWFFEAALEDASAAHNQEAIAFRRVLRTFCETATVNGPARWDIADELELDGPNADRHIAGSNHDSQPNPRQNGDEEPLRSARHHPARRRTRSLDTLRPSHYERDGGVLSGSVEEAPTLPPPPPLVVPGEEGAAPEDGLMARFALDISKISFEEPNAELSRNTAELIRRAQSALPGAFSLSSSVPPLYDEQLSEEELRRVSAEALKRKLAAVNAEAGASGDAAVALKTLTVKQERFDYFNDVIKFMRKLVRISLKLRSVLPPQRKEALRAELLEVNRTIIRRMAQEQPESTLDAVVDGGASAYYRSAHVPLIRAKRRALRVLRTLPDECVVFSTKQRAPYMLFVEGVQSHLVNCDGNLFCEHLVHDAMRYPAEPSALDGGGNGAAGDGASSAADRKRELERQALLERVYGELWEAKERRLLSTSPFQGVPNRRLYACIVKAGDDLRQEQLAVQLISEFDSVFRKEDVDVILRPFTIICLSAEAGLVELVPNAVSLHALKSRVPKFKSLRQYFERAYGPPGSAMFADAQRNFIQSMAGYSLVTYFLQVKDRHNGNIMLDSSGRVVHIDFGFMLSNTPGAINFETAAFKLNDEMLEVMGGTRGRGYRYFKQLFLEGFFAARKHFENFKPLVEIMVNGTNMPCMLKGARVIVDSLRRRFLLGIPEHEVRAKVNALVDDSCQNWRTTQYDRYQYMTNRIL